MLDNGEQHAGDFSEWNCFYKLKMRREAAFQKLSKDRLEKTKTSTASGVILLEPQEPTVEVF